MSICCMNGWDSGLGGGDGSSAVSSDPPHPSYERWAHQRILLWLRSHPQSPSLTLAHGHAACSEWITKTVRGRRTGSAAWGWCQENKSRTLPLLWSVCTLALYSWFEHTRLADLWKKCGLIDCWSHEEEPVAIVLGIMVLTVMDFDGPTRLNQDADHCKKFVHQYEQ